MPEVTVTAETEMSEVIAKPKSLAVPVATEGISVTVRGDNLCKIAKKLYGDEKGWIDIYNANVDVIGEGYLIWASQTLIIPSR